MHQSVAIQHGVDGADRRQVRDGVLDAASTLERAIAIAVAAAKNFLETENWQPNQATEDATEI